VGLTVFSRRGGALRPKKARDGFGVDLLPGRKPDPRLDLPSS